MTTRKIGLIVNPVAGMGGSVGLKGTDGDMYERALGLGAQPVSPVRTRDFLAHIGRSKQIEWIAAPGAMGADVLCEAGLDCTPIGDGGAMTTSESTREISRQMLAQGIELLVFAGGDGTARDVLDALGHSIPVIAIPAGVKIYSSVFAYSPAAAAELLDAFIDGTDVAEEEVLDIDEQAYREGRVESLHYGYLLVPEVERLLQAGKESSGTSASTLAAKQDLAAGLVEQFDDDVVYLLGCGTTLRAVADVLGVAKTLLGIDAVLAGDLIGADLNERDILGLLDAHEKVTIVVTPLGGNGFIFGRGNKQFTPAVLRRVGKDRIVVLASRDKLLSLGSLYVDTGDEALDEQFHGYIEVMVGRGYSKMMKVS